MAVVLIRIATEYNIIHELILSFAKLSSKEILITLQFNITEPSN